MRRIGGLWPDVVSFDNLLHAWRLARKGKNSRHEVARFAFMMEQALLRLQSELQSGCYQPGEYRQFIIRERKPRLISAAPFRDRVVHHAVIRQLEPRIDPSFIFDSYACRKGKGVHAAVNRYQQFAQHYRYVLKLDVQRYFPSINHAILKAELERRIKDRHVLQLLNVIIDGSPATDRPGCGIPIGNLTSQFFANLYLDRFDHWLKEEQRQPAYIRYVDDFMILGDDKQGLWQLCAAIDDQMAALGLRLHPTKRQIFRTDEKVDVFGYKVSQHRRWLRNDNGHRFSRKFRRMAKLYGEGRIDLEDVTPSVASWVGHAMHGETAGLRRAILSPIAFRRGEQAG